MKQYFYLYMYNISRLLIIALIITYFIGCITYFVATEINSQEDLEAGFGDDGRTFTTAFEMDALSENERLVTVCYFALTTLSTVGYGDLYAISNTEMVFTVTTMLMGVAFFSYIMGNFIDIISNYQEKMGEVDITEDLHRWLQLLTRFTGKTPLNLNLVELIEKNLLYHSNNDRLSFLKQMNQQDMESLPLKLKIEIVTEFLFKDVIRLHKRFFTS